MKKRFKSYLRLNIMSIFFIVVSFISVTLAWFAYSGLSRVSTEINVKAWYIELERNGEKVSNNVVISLDEIYPGMNVVTEKISIKNMGDSDANLKYSIDSARILDDPDDNYKVGEDVSQSLSVEDIIAHDYPFHVNINLSKNYVLTGAEEYFEVSISWPLDSDDDILDSTWGNKAYVYQNSEISKKNNDSNYQINPSIQIAINLVAEQYVESDSSSDYRFDKGDVILFDVVNNNKCSILSSNCIKTYVIDENNKLGDSTVTLLPDPIGTYSASGYNSYGTTLSNSTSSWSVNTRDLKVEDILKIASNDIIGSVLVRDGISDSIIGKLNNSDRITSELAKAINYNGYYRYFNEKFNYLSSVNCYWTSSNYNTNQAFAVKKIDDTSSIIYNESKETNCNIIPIIVADKENLI